MQPLTEIIKANRPNLATTSIKSYASIINALYRKLHNEVHGNTNDVTSFFSNNSKQVLESLKDMSPNKRKTLLASLVALCAGQPCIEDYRKQMIQDSEAYKKEIYEQKKSDTQVKNWISQEEVLDVYNKLQKQTSKLWKKSPLTQKEHHLLQDFVILSLYVLIPPRRILDYIAFKIRNINEVDDNFMKGRQFIFNKYKTAKRYHQQDVPIPQKLKNIITKWTNKNPTYEYLLWDEKNKRPMTQPTLTHRINAIFGGRKISVNQLRHTFITDNVLKNMPALTHMQDVAEKMGNSVEEQILYKKL